MLVFKQKIKKQRVDWRPQAPFPAKNGFKNRKNARKGNSFGRRKELMASVRRPREKLCASAFHPSKNSKKGVPKVGGFAAHFACGFFECWKGGTRSRIVFLEVFARGPLTLSDDNILFTTEPKFKNNWIIADHRSLLDPHTRFSHIGSSDLPSLWR